MMINSQSKDALVVYQMGKVGSSSVVQSLKALGIDMSIYHVHYLTHSGIASIEKSNPKPPPTHIVESRYLRNQIDKSFNGRKWKIVTLVREPIARNISAFFENINKWCIDLNTQHRTKSIKIEELIELFLEKYPHDVPLTWFDSEIKCVFGIDVFSSNFPKSKGYKIYEAEHADILLIRLENMNQCASEAFKDFLNIERFSLIKTNISTEKVYHDAYSKFVDSIVLPQLYINRMYTSKYTWHFYCEEEINTFITKWRKNKHYA